jgi:hypothetical protein
MKLFQKTLIATTAVVGLGVLLKPVVFPENYYSSATDTCHVGKQKITHFDQFEKTGKCTADGGYKLDPLWKLLYADAVVEANTFDMSVKARMDREYEIENKKSQAKYEAEQQKAADEEAKKTLLWADGALAGMQRYQDRCFELENEYGIRGRGC